MRCSLIIASFALVLLAAPVPQGQALAIEKRGQRNSETSDLVHRNIKREPEPLQRGQYDRREPEALQRGQYDRREPEPLQRGQHDRREAEPLQRSQHDRREPEPLQRGQHDRREPEPLQRGQYDRREPEAEPGVHDTNQEQSRPSRPIHPRSVVDISLRDIYNSAAGVVQSLKTRDFNNAIIEALKGRGFSSANLLEPM